jgi:hypothetical protein
MWQIIRYQTNVLAAGKLALKSPAFGSPAIRRVSAKPRDQTKAFFQNGIRTGQIRPLNEFGLTNPFVVFSKWRGLPAQAALRRRAAGA